MAKFVAFIDTLGFRDKISKISHKEAEEFIRIFNQSVFNLWRKQQLDIDQSIQGRTFSDSIIIYSSGSTQDELKKILRFTIELYRKSIFEYGLPLRGGLAHGDFSDLQAVEFNNLQKGLVVGTAFIESYLLESNRDIKGSKLLFGQSVNLKIEKLKEYQTRKVRTEKDGTTIYELKWGDLEYLTDNSYQALNKFVELGVQAKWLEHYFGTLETFLINETDDNRREIFSRILTKLRTYKWHDMDLFIENYMKTDSAQYTKRSFLKFIRGHLS